MIEGVPAHRAAGFDDFLESSVFAFAVEQCFSRPQAAAHDFRDEQAASVNLADESLAHDVTNRVRKPLPKLLLLVLAEHAEDAVDRLSRIDRVHCREDDVTGLGRGHRDFHRGAVANFADQNHFRRLAESGAQAAGEIGKILSELALIEERLFVRMEKLDRIFQGQNVNLLRQVQLIQHRGERRRFSAAGGARHENDPVLLLDHFLEDRRELRGPRGWEFRSGACASRSLAGHSA